MTRENTSHQSSEETVLSRRRTQMRDVLADLGALASMKAPDRLLNPQWNNVAVFAHSILSCLLRDMPDDEAADSLDVFERSLGCIHKFHLDAATVELLSECQEEERERSRKILDAWLADRVYLQRSSRSLLVHEAELKEDKY